MITPPNCPYCSTKTTAGFLIQEHTWRTILGRGFCVLDVFFEAGDDPRRLVMAPGDNTRAYRCSYCGAIVVPPDGTGAAISCLSCSRLIRQERPFALLAGGHTSQREAQMRGHRRPNQAMPRTAAAFCGKAEG